MTAHDPGPEFVLTLTTRELHSLGVAMIDGLLYRLTDDAAGLWSPMGTDLLRFADLVDTLAPFGHHVFADEVTDLWGRILDHGEATRARWRANRPDPT